MIKKKELDSIIKASSSKAEVLGKIAFIYHDRYGLSFKLIWEIIEEQWNRCKGQINEEVIILQSKI